MSHHRQTPPRSGPSLPIADDRFVDSLLEEHARLGSSDDKALLALIRARTVEQPGSGHFASERIFGILQWAQVAAVVLLIGVAISVAVRNYVPIDANSQEAEPLVAAHAEASEDEVDHSHTSVQPQTIKHGTVAPHTDPKIQALAPLDELLSTASVDLSPAIFGEWQSPLTAPLSKIDIGEKRDNELSFEALQQLVASGQPVPKGSVSVGTLLGHFHYDYPQPASDARSPVAIDLSTAACPWNSHYQLVRVAVQAGDGNKQDGAPNDVVELLADDSELLVEFNPAQIARYRLLGYAADAEGGPATFASGQQVTALYEIETIDRAAATETANLKYQPDPQSNPATRGSSSDLLSANFRYRTPNDRQSHLLGASIAHDATNARRPLEKSPIDFQLACATTLFGITLRADTDYLADANLALVEQMLNRVSEVRPEAGQMQHLVSAFRDRAGR